MAEVACADAWQGAPTMISNPKTTARLAGLRALVGEVPFVFWLLIKGVDATRWREAAQA